MKKYAITEEDRVRLRPLFGIPPKRYIPAVYAFLLLALLFALLVLPGLISSGAELSVEPALSDAGIWVDGRYIGSVSQKPFIESGVYDISVRKPYFTPVSFEEKQIDGRVLFSLFSKKTIPLPVSWEFADLDGYSADRLQSLAEWARVLDYGERYHYPDILSRAAADFSHSQESFPAEAEQFFTAALHMITSSPMFSDLEEALDLLPSDTADRITNERLYDLLHSRFTDSGGSALADYIEGISSSVPDFDDTRLYERINVEDQRFLYVPPIDSLLLGSVEDPADIPVTVDTDGFYMGNREITERDYARFVEENPEWDAVNRNTLISEGLVDRHYLQDVSIDNPSQRPIRSISWYAAEAYTSWVTQKHAEYRFELPSEAQWQAAVTAYNAAVSYTSRLLIVERQANSLFGMMGSLWEFTDSEYVPHRFGHSGSLFDEIELDQITVKGGSYVNERLPSSVRGQIERSACSPFIGFRMIMTEKQEQ